MITDYYQCRECGEYFTERMIEARQVLAPTWEQPGEAVSVCPCCGYAGDDIEPVSLPCCNKCGLPTVEVVGCEIEMCECE